METVLAAVLLFVFAQLAPPPEADEVRAEPAESTEAQPPAESQTESDRSPIEAPSRPAGQDGLVPLHTAGANLSPPALVLEILTPPRQDALFGQPVSLYQVLAESPDTAGQRERIRAYWNLSAAVARYQIAIETAVKLEDEARKLDRSDPRVDAQWAVALANARTRVEESRLAAVTAQHRLAELRPVVTSAALPLPLDLPHSGAYRTLYERYFANRPSAIAKRLQDTLPLRHGLLHALAAEVDAVAHARDVTTESTSSDGATTTRITDILERSQHLADAQNRFVDEVHAYNLDIAEYALIAAPPGLDASQFVAMLIKTDNAPKPLASALQQDGLSSVLKRPTPANRGQASPPSGIVPATAEGPIRNSADEGTGPHRARDLFVPRREAK